MYNCALLKFKKINSVSNPEFGYLTPIENMEEIPFNINRIYYIYNVGKDIARGHHSHKHLHQVLICVNGSIDITLENYFGKKTFTLDDPSVGLYIGPDNWRVMHNFTENTVLLVLASEKYDPDDYIRDYDVFIDYNNKKYGGKK